MLSNTIESKWLVRKRLMLIELHGFAHPSYQKRKRDVFVRR